MSVLLSKFDLELRNNQVDEVDHQDLLHFSISKDLMKYSF